MNYTSEITIALPREKLLDLFQNDRFVLSWLDGLKIIRHISGKRFHRGSITEMVFDMDGKDVVIVETILETNYPDSYDAHYKTKAMINITRNKLIDQGDSTLWQSENIFKLSGLSRIFEPFMKKQFVKKTNADMQKLKLTAENW